MASKNGHEPATKQDLLELEQRIEQRFTGIEQRFAGMEDKFTEALREMETKLLRAFYTFAEATQRHLADLDNSDSSIRQRIAAFEVRLTEIERRMNFPGSGSGQ